MTNLRSYLAGTGASGSLLLSVLFAFFAVGALVAFDGLPVGGDGDSSEAITLLGPDGSGAAAGGAAAAVGGIPGAVAASPVVASDGATVAVAPASPGGADFGPAPLEPRGEPGPDPGPDPPGPPPPAPLCADGSAPPCNPVQQALGTIDQASEESLGVNPGLSGLSKPATDALDKALKDTTGSDLGGHLDGLSGRSSDDALLP